MMVVVVTVVMIGSPEVYDGIRNMSLISQEETVMWVVRLSRMTRTIDMKAQALSSVARREARVKGQLSTESVHPKARWRVTQGKHDSSLPNVTPSAHNSP